MRRSAFACLIVVLMVRPIAAQAQRAILEIVVNAVPSGESLVVLRDSDAWIATAFLARAGMKDVAGRRESFAGDEFVSLASLAPDVRFQIDEVRLRLMLTVNPDRLGRSLTRVSTNAPPDLVFRQNPSAFMNYAVNWDDRNRVELFTESAASVKGALLYSTASSRAGGTTRGLTNITIDDRRRMRRWTAGDSFAYSGPLGGDAWIAGLSVAREFGLDPYFVRYPTLSLSTPIAVPSVIEVEVNGRVVRQEAVAPGRLDISSLPLTLGRNDARVIVRDAFGGARELSSTYYISTTALAPGVHDYQYAIGFRRAGLGLESWDYRTLVALARHRVGLTESFTAGGRVEVEPARLFSAGPSFNLRLPLGEIEGAASISRSNGQWGSAALAAFTYTDRRVSAGGSLAASTRGHTTLARGQRFGPSATDATVFASLRVFGPLSVTGQHRLASFYDRVDQRRTSVLSNVHVARRLELTTSVTTVGDERGRVHESYVGMTVLLGGGRSASVSLSSDAQGARLGVDAQKPLPVGVGYGYQVRANGGSSSSVDGVARYQGNHGRYEVRQDSFGGGAHTSVSVAGALVGIGGNIFATRPVQNSFALVRVAGVEGVRAFASHQEIGRTNRRGDLLIPDLQAYYGNILNIADADVPLEYAVPKVNLTLAPPYRGGAVAEFTVRKVQPVTGTIVIVEGGEVRVPAYGDLTIATRDQRFVSPIGSAGEFYFEDLPAGSYAATVEKDGGQCRFTLDVPVTDRPWIDVGLIRCRQP